MRRPPTLIINPLRDPTVAGGTAQMPMLSCYRACYDARPFVVCLTARADAKLGIGPAGAMSHTIRSRIERVATRIAATMPDQGQQAIILDEGDL
ncbi:MAG TPA: hypothetical protein VF649_05385 [Sphingomonas sp.]|jgi:hypothetical protein|uniref:hypothetical protein n=1 Tax=Sphingomonas sp. TaxID=28214 RepID=UPI002ED9155A